MVSSHCVSVKGITHISSHLRHVPWIPSGRNSSGTCCRVRSSLSQRTASSLIQVCVFRQRRKPVVSLNIYILQGRTAGSTAGACTIPEYLQADTWRWIHLWRRTLWWACLSQEMLRRLDTHWSLASHMARPL